MDYAKQLKKQLEEQEKWLRIKRGMLIIGFSLTLFILLAIYA